MPGYDLQVLDNAGNPVNAGPDRHARRQAAAAAVVPADAVEQRRALPSSYIAEFPGYYTTSDAGYMDEDGYAFVMARTDDVINVAGHRLSTGQMEEVVARHKDVAECAVMGVADAHERPDTRWLYRAQRRRQPAARRDRGRGRKLVREEIGPVAAFKTVMTVKRLPKTRSGKILRGTMRQIADGEPWKMPATIDDPVILDEITGVMQGRGMVRANADKA